MASWDLVPVAERPNINKILRPNGTPSPMGIITPLSTTKKHLAFGHAGVSLSFATVCKRPLQCQCQVLGACVLWHSFFRLCSFVIAWPAAVKIRAKSQLKGQGVVGWARKTAARQPHRWISHNWKALNLCTPNVRAQSSKTFLRRHSHLHLQCVLF